MAEWIDGWTDGQIDIMGISTLSRDIEPHYAAKTKSSQDPTGPCCCTTKTQMNRITLYDKIGPDSIESFIYHDLKSKKQSYTKTCYCVCTHDLSFPRQRQCLYSLDGISSHGTRIPNVPQLAVSHQFIGRGIGKEF